MVANQEEKCLVARELGHSLGSLGHSVLGQFTGKHKANSSLNFSAGQGGFLVVGRQLSSLGGNTFKNVVNERVHDRHTLLRNTRVRVDLLQYFVDVRGVGFDTLLRLGRTGGLLRGLGGLLRGSLGHGCE